MAQVSSPFVQTAEQLRQAASLLEGFAGLPSQVKALRDRADRLEANRFTVALFGAFSAGKSSFANALLGDMVLPVSPNPTTAAINKIVPPTEQFPHGTVRVILKTREVMEEDVLRSLSVFDLSAGSMAEALNKATEIDAATVAPQAKPHYTFLKAVVKGIGEMEERLGQELIVDLQAFKGFVAKEEKACFVDHIELYYACPLTEQGIVLVDTPGADSINARHTGVAFDYLKNADAILFVTYYNHAFAQADREFLLQMGRVKDTFELDKMFFIVNAADLASSPEELKGVLEHVEKNLLQCGIRLPRLYPVSSQTALLAHLHRQGKLTPSAEKVYRQRAGWSEGQPLGKPEEALAISGLPAFEQDFRQFILGELTQLAVDAAVQEVKRAVTAVSEFVQMAEAGAQEREERLRSIQAAQSGAEQYVRTFSAASEERDLAKEAGELLYHVKQRLFYRFSELFGYAFNPAVLREDGGQIKKALQISLHELVRSIRFDLEQEIRATGLRLERFVNKSLRQVMELWDKELGKWLTGFSTGTSEDCSLELPACTDQALEPSLPDLQSALSLFRNTKDFFEGEGRVKLREELEKGLREPVSRFVQENGDRLMVAAVTLLRETLEQRRQSILRAIGEHAKGLAGVLQSEVDLDHLRQTLSRLNDLYHHMKSA